MGSLGNITSANATAILTVNTLFPAGIKLDAFATDQSVSQDEITYTENRMGVDGRMGSGFVPAIKPVTIMLEPFSSAVTSLAQVAAAMTQNRTIYACTLTVTVPSINTVYIWTNGVLKSGTPFPSHKKTLDATTWKFEFADFAFASL